MFAAVGGLSSLIAFRSFSPIRLTILFCLWVLFSQPWHVFIQEPASHARLRMWRHSMRGDLP